MRTVNYVDTYQVEVIKNDSFEQEVTFIVQSLMHKESQVANPAYPPRRNGEIKELVQ
jgi:hypothetical protein